MIDAMLRAAVMAAAVLLVIAAGSPAAVAQSPAAAPSGNAILDFDPWPGIRKDLFGARDIAEDEARITLDAPVRAEDAALVPITVRIPAATAADATRLTLIVDKNPAPIAAAFTFGPGAGLGDRVVTTRVRVDMYTHIRAVVETADGRLVMAAKYVKAAGGCSAPALKDADEALAQLGRMQLRTFDPAAATTPQSKALREAQVMIKHPNYSGMQMNQLTGLYIPAKYVQQMEVRRDGELVFKLEGGISLSEDPNIRFTYADGGPGGGALEVTARDTDGREFKTRSSSGGS